HYVEAVSVIDTALSLFPDSPGAAKCFNQRCSITRKNIIIWQTEVVASGEPHLAVVTMRNVDHIYFRIVQSFDYYGLRDENQRRRKLMKAPVLKQWDQPVAMRDDYLEQKAYAVIPPMEQGHYFLLASNTPDFDTFGIALGEFFIEDIVFLPAYGEAGVTQRGFVVNRKSGKPVSGQKVTLMSCEYNKCRDLTTVTTNRDGYYDFTPFIKSNWNKLLYKDHRVSTTYKGYKTIQYGSIDEDSRNNPSNRTFRFFTDRPVYKPGDTIGFAFLAAYYDRYKGGVLLGMSVRFKLLDINGKQTDTLLLKTDEYGICEGRFVLPADAMPGQWRISTGQDFRYETAYLNVEAYKQPKFTVTLAKPAEVRHFGQTARVEGVASSYTAVPISGATVDYSVTRIERKPYWNRGWMSWWNTSTQTVIAEGELVTADDGSFVVDFVPLPDSNSDRKSCYEYRVKTKVTDINGETHEASTSLSVGYVNSYASIAENVKSRNDVELSVVCVNLDGKTIDGTADIEVVRLATPAKPYFNCKEMQYGDTTIAMPFSREEFERMFPLFDFSGTASDYECWPVEKQVFTTMARTTADSPYKYTLSGMPAGAYRLTARIRTDSGDTVTASRTVLYQPGSSKQPVLSQLITADIENDVVEVGGKVRLRVGSRYPDVTVYLVVNKNNVSCSYRLVKLNREFKELEIPVVDSLLGGFRIEVAAILANQIEHNGFGINVPYSDKKLDMAFDLETFRNKLEPGSDEQWTLIIKEKKTGLPAAANLLMTMYDHALDSYGSLQWHLNPWQQSYNPSTFSDINHYGNSSYRFEPKIPYRDYKVLNFRTVMFKYPLSESVYGFRGRYNSTRMYKSAQVIDIGAPESGQRITSEDIERMPSSVDGIVASVAGVNYKGESNEVVNELAVFYDESVEDEISQEAAMSSGDEVQVRQNLHTLAFFRPTLRSGNDGRIRLSFTVPELLTEWSINGLAYTKDLKIGTLTASAITQKRLMVTPNVPRFLRHGDTCVFSVKVSNLSDKEQTINVSLEMTNAASGEPMTMIVGDSEKRITLKNGTNGEVSFVLAVPREPVFISNYKVIARGDGVSDGEQAAIPLLPSRQLVTESMAFYINGAGEKSFELKHLVETGNEKQRAENFTLLNHFLLVDFTPNPIWLAVQSLPYIKQLQDPSNIYLANAIYANSLSFNIVNDNPQIEQLFVDWEKNNPDAFLSQLDRNADIKQTVMEETPWLNDAVSEEQQHRDVARFFNKTTLSRQLQKDLDRLLAAQRSDGSWSWIEGARWPSLYTTQYILKTFGLLRQQGIALDSRTEHALNRAMDYVDRETYIYYKKYIKGSTFEPVNLDYLYLRSLYPDNKLSKTQQEAYDFFYGNAKKYNENYRNLYTQAMLSVVFNRAGDKKLAHEMAVRIREKALYNDEMGMYWRDNTSGWCWYERPIETQAMLIRTFAEVLDDNASVAKMQQWLLKQKQTTNWRTDVATVNAIQAILEQNTHNGIQKTDKTGFAIHNSPMTVSFGSHILATDTTRAQLHVSHRLEGREITPADGRITIRKADDGIAWGAMYWQYFENIEKIPASSMGATLKRSFYRVEKNGTLTPLSDNIHLKVGDRIRVRLTISADRNLEYLELKDPRCAAFEPLSTASGWHSNGQLSFYLAVTNAATTLYIDRLDKGSYYAEYDLYVNNAGSYITAPATIQCLYAPEFRALCPADKIIVHK
ncbi:MAG: hypothetical protein J6031_05755, partial [Bacteroidales bacterium]|nr:hypothetical protein [Bacteroidales bacterium]